MSEYNETQPSEDTPAQATPGVADPSRGRPRDPQVDERIRQATLELLSERGFADTTITAVARRAGVGAPAIYRRWPSRTAMIENAIFPGFDRVVVRPTGDLRRDLKRYVDAFVATFDQPAARAALPALLSVYQSDPDNNALAGQRVGGSVREPFHQMLAKATPGDTPTGIDSDDVLDMLIGSVLFHLFIRRFSGRDMDSDYIVDLLTRAITAGQATP
ncbi:TetR/AcrR family transcriptional regulator [Frankia sp. CNm7]|uniref:TetR/AcrR family transcriptional regulator n=1 Tax=Frankia nepalensis TaxID=1836974 RepID=A0A937RSL6_9ACTN|nr:TetR/AcrR family transcriptional regulator [Frankia nepalensis]MBL7495002.1 TetR/AcrR family transcriptional regulator [Frankia nepalensis]MBL7514687.1 TetR/AcrR family transcriptional regulator [Frankia nepalensis]MBL7519265.1 TetR/AcrR family transcriptional regulator [Frankia nepalensis]MBL7631988.1 TetR/AcrR family transcriptional regulator [Frankia nepalensis]